MHAGEAEGSAAQAATPRALAANGGEERLPTMNTSAVPAPTSYLCLHAGSPNGPESES